jgi:lipoprotein NlpI
MYDEAVVDFDAVVRLDPNRAGVHGDIGVCRMGKKQYEKAHADFGAFIRLAPGASPPHSDRAVAGLILGRADAVADALRVVEIEGWGSPASGPAAIVGWMAARRAKDDATARRILDDAAANLDRAAWPYPVIRFLRREIDEAELLKLADGTGRDVEARFGVAFAQVLDGRADRAREGFRRLAEDADIGSTEYVVSIAELDRLDHGPPPGGR